jgi:hypothetical protein
MVNTERVIYRHCCNDPLSPRRSYAVKPWFQRVLTPSAWAEWLADCPKWGILKSVMMPPRPLRPAARSMLAPLLPGFRQEEAL